MYSAIGRISLNRRERPAASYPALLPEPEQDLYLQYRHSIQNKFHFRRICSPITYLTAVYFLQLLYGFLRTVSAPPLGWASLRTTCGGSCFHTWSYRLLPPHGGGLLRGAVGQNALHLHTPHVLHLLC